MCRVRLFVVPLFYLLIVGFIGCSTGRRIAPHRPIWAVLIAGSKGFSNYRHQADVSHAYQFLISHGVPKHRIITIMYDDVANDPQNPYPGQLFNWPNGTDVYAGVAVDYRGDDIRPELVFGVLSGNTSAVAGVGSGRVIESNYDDNIFIYFVGDGYFGFFNLVDEVIYAKDLLDLLSEMSESRRFNHLLFYTDTTESGSIFTKLPPYLRIYAVTATGRKEMSYSTYCHHPMPLIFELCIGDLFTVSWLESAEKATLSSTQLVLQYHVLKKLVKSSVYRFGDMKMNNYLTAEFMGWDSPPKQMGPVQDVERDSLPSRDMSLMIAQRKYQREVDEKKKKILKEQLDLLIEKREYLDKFMNQFVRSVIDQTDANPEQKLNEIFQKHPVAQEQHECFKEVTDAFIKECFNYGKNPYAASYSYVLANLCELGYQSDKILKSIDEMCQTITMNDIQ